MTTSNTIAKPTRLVAPTYARRGPKNADYYNQKVKDFSAQLTTSATSIQKRIDASQQAAALLSQPTLTPAEAETLLSLHEIVG